MRVVLDTNVLISAVMSSGSPPGQIFDAIESGRLTLVTSAEQLAEFEAVIDRPKLQRFFRNGRREAVLRLLAERTERVGDLPTVTLSRDPDDDLILATAVAGRVDALVTGDRRDLLALESVEGIPIVSPRRFLDLLDQFDPPGGSIGSR